MSEEKVRGNNADIPAEFVPNFTVGPRYSYPLCFMRREFDVEPNKALERIMGFTYKPDPTIALLVLDHVKPEIILKGHNSNPILTNMMYSPEEIEKLEELAEMPEDADFTGHEVPYNPFDRTVMLFSEGKKGNTSFRTRFTIESDYHMNHQVVHLPNDFPGYLMMHQYVCDFNILTERHQNSVQKINRFEPEPYDDLATVAYERLMRLKTAVIRDQDECIRLAIETSDLVAKAYDSQKN